MSASHPPISMRVKMEHSPKYFLRARNICAYITVKRLEEKWRKKTRHDMKRQFYPDPVQHLDIHVNIDTVTSQIRSSIRNGTYTVRSPSRYYVEKSKGLCRLMVQPRAEDAIVLQCLSDKLYSQIKNQAPSKNAFFEPKDHSFNQNQEPEYGTFKSWKDFQSEILKFTKENSFVVISDISNYYDFIDFTQLRNVVTSLVRLNETLFDFLIHILTALAWQPDFMPPRQIGLPQMDFDGPRLLAHSYLFELDRFMENRSQKNYARFMDDIDAGVDTIKDAKHLLRDTDLVLQSRSLRLNAGKTKILTAKEALRHFRVRENNFLDRFEASIKSADEKGLPVIKILTKFEKIFRTAYNNGYFIEGNGEKIIKRCVNICTRHGILIDSNLYASLIRLHPNIRESALRNRSRCGFNSEDINLISNIYKTGIVCDDAFTMNVARAIVDGKIDIASEEADVFRELLKSMTGSPGSLHYAKLWILSRIGKYSTILLYINKGPIYVCDPAN
ncbi:RNA-directed DNA polymerase [Aurantimonas marina]|uniref:RNA-directed DNA polymerase n=1 Tax=Aurantimonas marina TaxID=2780508 RepID=UPI0019D2B531|nr:RNA-directed DNA polymerase [Aurantimonas marina]